MYSRLKEKWHHYLEQQQRRQEINNIKDSVKKAFHTAQLFLKITNDYGSTFVYPTIQNIEHPSDIGYWKITFTIPRGINPKNVHDKAYIFQQYLGKEALLEGDLLAFTIRLIPSRMDSVPFEYSSFPIKDMEMPIVVGQNRNRDWITFSLINNPNVLIAGIPGSGKSVMLRQLLCTLILRHKPEELEMHLVDLKGSEFHLFENVAHVKDVCITPEQFSPIMRRLKAQLEKRGSLLRKYGVAHINKLPKDRRPPYILLAIDEMLILSGSLHRDINADLLRWAALGRALGCYTIISMQRPCNKSLDTALRGILNARLVFKTEDKTNSEIAGIPGAENIPREDPGRMLFKIDSNEVEDVKAPLLTEEELSLLLSSYQKHKNNKLVIDDLNPEQEKIFGLLEEES